MRRRGKTTAADDTTIKPARTRAYTKAASCFFRFPREIRDIIYGFVLTTNNITKGFANYLLSNDDIEREERHHRFALALILDDPETKMEELHDDPRLDCSIVRTC